MGLEEKLDTAIDESVDRGLGLSPKASWVPYSGPRGGSGWRNVETGDVEYSDDPPGEAVDDASLDAAMEEALEDDQYEALMQGAEDDPAQAMRGLVEAEPEAAQQVMDLAAGGSSDGEAAGDDESDMVAAEDALADADVPFDYNDDGISAAAGAADGLDDDTIDAMRDAGYEPTSVDTTGDRADVQFTDERPAGPGDVDQAAAESALEGHAFDYRDDGAIETSGTYNDAVTEGEVDDMREAGYEVASVDDDGGVRFEKADDGGGDNWDKRNEDSNGTDLRSVDTEGAAHQVHDELVEDGIATLDSYSGDEALENAILDETGVGYDDIRGTDQEEVFEDVKDEVRDQVRQISERAGSDVSDKADFEQKLDARLDDALGGLD